MKPAPFRYLATDSVEEAIRTLIDCGDDAKIIAGGQSLGPLLNLRLAFPEVLVDINRIENLDHINETEDGDLTIGALTRHRALEISSVVQSGWSSLCAAASQIGHRAIRNRGTIGGSLAHADPSAELPTVLVALNARITVAGDKGSSEVSAAELFRGAFTTALLPDEMITGVRIPRINNRNTQSWHEVSRRAGDFGIVGLATVLEFERDNRIQSAKLVFSGIDSVPWTAESGMSLLRDENLSRELIDEVAEHVAAACSPSSDAQASARYRRRLVHTLTVRALDQCATKTRDTGEGAA